MTYRGRLTGPDDRIYDAVLHLTASLPVPAVVARSVMIGGTTLGIDGIDRSRGVGELILYRSKVPTSTNRWGVEVAVRGGLVRLRRERMREPDMTSGIGTGSPEDDYVLSGHGAVGARLYELAHPGAAVRLLGEAGGAPGYPHPEIAIYKKLWPGDLPRLADIPDAFNVIRLAFAHGPDLALPGWGADDRESFLAAARAARARGARLTLALGGQDGTVDFRDSRRILDGLRAAHALTEGMVTGIDIDLERGELPVTDAVRTVEDAKIVFGGEFSISLAPNGSNVAPYLQLAGTLVRLGLLDSYGQQFYEGDKPITTRDVISRVEQAMAAGVPPEKIALGVMLGDGPKYWTVDRAIDVLRTVRTAVSVDIARVYLWEAGRPDASAFGERVSVEFGRAGKE